MNREPDELELSSNLTQVAAELRERFRACPEPAVLQAFRAGVLPAESSVEVMRHVENCSLCKLTVQDMEEVDRAPLAEADRIRIWNRIQSGITPGAVHYQVGSPTAGFWQSMLRPWPIATTAVLLIGIAILIGLNLKRVSPVRQEEAVSQLPPDSGSGQVARPATPEQSPTAGSVAFRLDKPPVRLPAAAVMVWRGESAGPDSQTKELAEALAPYRIDKFAEAERRLQEVAKRYPRLAEAPFYLGVCELFLNRNEDAAVSLKAARGLARKQLAAETDWYLAMAYHRIGQDGEARPLLEKLCRSVGKDSARACSALGELSTAP
jgi:tetratricopeptide (TPR) repeat protein